MPSSGVAAVYLCDENYHNITETSIASLLLNCRFDMGVHFFQNGYSRTLPENFIEYMENNGFKIFMHHLSLYDVETNIDKFHGHISKTTLLKAYAIEQIVDNYNLIIYTDGDVLVMNEIRISEFNRSDILFFANFDYTNYMPFDGQNIIEHSLWMGVSPEYFNSGFLIINAARWKSIGGLDKFKIEQKKHKELCVYRHEKGSHTPTKCPYGDQCIFNMMANGDWLPLPESWNVQRPARYLKIWKNAVVRHYIGPNKFYPAVNRFRDKQEVKMLRKIERLFGTTYIGEKIYDFGMMFKIDSLRFLKVSMAYRETIKMLDSRRKNLWTRTKICD